MATLLYRLGRTAYRRWPAFVAVWIAALIALGATASSISQPMMDKFTVPGIPSLQAQQLQQRLFHEKTDALDQATATVVVQAPAGHTLTEPAYSRAVTDLIARLEKLPNMPKQPLASPAAAAAAQYRHTIDAQTRIGVPVEQAQSNARSLLPLSPDKRTGTISWTFDVHGIADVTQATHDQLLQDLAPARASGLEVEVMGTAMQQLPSEGGASELAGIVIAALVLLLTFGSFVAAGLPILTALVGVGIGMLGITAATAFTTISTTTPLLATMIGLAVGIDYTLFILSRYRSELKHTRDRSHAAGLAVGKAGSAVVFAGLTVLIALSALSVVGIPFLTSMGLAAGGTVLFAVLVALTLLPAILGMLKGKAFGAQVRRPAEIADEHGAKLNNGVRWSRLLGRRPGIIVALVVVILGALAVPISSMRLALPSDSTSAVGTTQREAADLVAGAFGPGRDAPLLTVVDATALPGATDRQQAFGQVTAWAAAQHDVANAQIIAVNKQGTGAQVLITPKSGQDAQATTDLLTNLRAGRSAVEKRTGATIGITGITAIQTDVSDALTSALPKYLAVVIGLAFLLLMLVFRSVLVPLTATAGFLLSVLATLGTTVLVFQQGLFGIVDGEPLVSFMPIILIGIVFGLAMDYQVFLVTRMREAHVHGQSARAAVVDGFRHGARVVAAAATIMISVFAAFVLQSDPLIQSMGFALAVAVFLDAFVVRMTLIPAVMYLLGDKAWWLPRWLDTLLPRIDVEGESLSRSLHVQPPAPRHAAGAGAGRG